jgi:hypothetical protein
MGKSKIPPKTPKTPKSTQGESIPHTTDSQRLSMIHWLEVPSNFALITGNAAANQSVVSGKRLRKKDAYQMLAEVITKESGISWTPKNAESRYTGYLKKYKETKQLSQRTGLGSQKVVGDQSE